MASMTGLTAEQLAQLLDGPNPMPMPSYSLDSIYGGTGLQSAANPLPTYVEGGIIPPIGVAGTKRNRNSLPASYNSLTEPWGGAYDQTAYRSPAPMRLPSEPTGGPKKQPQIDTQTAYVREVDPYTLGYSDRLDSTPNAQDAIEIMVRGGTPMLPRMPMAKPNFPSMSDPLLEEALAIGRAYKPSAKVQAALDAPPPPGSPGAAPVNRSGGLLSLLLGGMSGGGGPASGASSGGLSALLSGDGHPMTSPEAFAADVTRPSNIPGVEQFNGRVEMGQAGQNRYGSTARNELLALYT